MILNFISDTDFKEHIRETILQYGERLQPYDLEKLNGNIIDPIKLLFDKNIYGFTWEEIIKSEIFRQRDKSNNNSIGYFHQNIFRYIDGCTVPRSGWDVIFKKKGGIGLDGDKVGTIYVEMKNKHNTINSSSGAKTFMKMQGQLLRDDDCACYLVEVIAKKSQNIPWAISLDGQKQKYSRIRRMSIDKFYELVTGESDAFYKMCMALPAVIKELLEEADTFKVPEDTAFVELKEKAAESSFELALFMLGFETYSGFNENFFGRRNDVG